MGVMEMPPPKSVQAQPVNPGLSASEVAASRAEQQKRPKSFTEQLERGHKATVDEMTALRLHIEAMKAAYDILELRASKMLTIMEYVKDNPVAAEAWKMVDELPHPDKAQEGA